jgi:hypothetical protein
VRRQFLQRFAQSAKHCGDTPLHSDLSIAAETPLCGFASVALFPAKLYAVIRLGRYGVCR